MERIVLKAGLLALENDETDRVVSSHIPINTSTLRVDFAAAGAAHTGGASPTVKPRIA